MEEGEFLGMAAKTFHKSNDIRHADTLSENKAALAERAVRTLKNSLYKICTANRSHKYLSILSQFKKQYNRSVHRSTERTQIASSSVIREKYFLVIRSAHKISFKKNHVCAISRSPHKGKPTIRKGLQRNILKGDIYRENDFSSKIPNYRPKKFAGAVVPSRFYFEELEA